MELKEYMAPEMDVIEIKMRASLMVISGADEDEDDPIGGEGGGTYDPSKPWG